MAIFSSHVVDFHGSEEEKLAYKVLHRLPNDYVFYSFRWLEITGIGFPSFFFL